MPTNIEVQPEVAERLAAFARAKGISIDTLLRDVLDRIEESRNAIDPSIEEFERDMDAVAEGLDVAPAYQGTYSRADIYFDHD